MDFGPVPVAKAEGGILAHSLHLNGTRLRKGITLSAHHVTLLVQEGIATVTIARLGTADVHENTAAERLAQAIVDETSGLRIAAAATGRVNIYATTPGLAHIDVAKVHALNAVNPLITVATVPEWQRMAAGGMVATVKIISYAVPDGDLARVCALGAGALGFRTPIFEKVQFIQTTLTRDDKTGHSATEGRLTALGVKMDPPQRVPHDTEALSKALLQSAAPLICVLTASATSDLRDVAPAAVVAAGGLIHVFGMPVDPGNLLFIGDIDGRQVIGLPGCARSPALNGADWVLERLVCGVDVTPADIAQMGVGGLLKEIPTRPRPRES